MLVQKIGRRYLNMLLGVFKTIAKGAFVHDKSLLHFNFRGRARIAWSFTGGIRQTLVRCVRGRHHGVQYLVKIRRYVIGVRLIYTYGTKPYGSKYE